MVSARRQQILRSLGVDLYRRRSAQPAAPGQALEDAPAVVPANTPDREPGVKAKPATAVAETQVSYRDESLALIWWQFDDLLILEETVAEPQDDGDLQRLATAIAAALGRQSGPRGELRWPPGGNFTLISLDDFLGHFVQGRSEASQVLQLVVTSDRLMSRLSNSLPVQIPALSAMLAQPDLKAAAWTKLKVLKR